MDTKNNFYELLEVMKSSSTREILGAYENKITKFNNISNLSDNQINEIKMLKVALYVLITPNLRSKYNKYLDSKNNKSSDSKNNKNKKRGETLNTNRGYKQDEPLAMNQEMESSLDVLFNVDNTWMKNDPNINDTSSRKNKFENNTLGDRVFSMSQFNKRPGYSSDFECELRKPLQGREDKSSQLTK
jgi:DnaJ-class molecular chaperone